MCWEQDAGGKTREHLAGCGSLALWLGFFKFSLDNLNTWNPPAWGSPFPLPRGIKKHGSTNYDKKVLIPGDTGSLLGAPWSEEVESILRDKWVWKERRKSALYTAKQTVGNEINYTPSSASSTQHRERKSLMLIKIMFWYSLLITLVSLCGSFQLIRLKKLPKDSAALKSGRKKGFICMHFITTAFHYFNIVHLPPVEIPWYCMQIFFFFVKTWFFFPYERFNLSKSFLLCENDVQLIGLLDREQHPAIGWVRRVPEVWLIWPSEMQQKVLLGELDDVERSWALQTSRSLQSCWS